MQKRILVLGLGGTFLASFAASAVFVACGNSNNTTPNPTPDTGTKPDTGTTQQEASTFDVSLGDTNFHFDQNVPDVPGKGDAGKEAGDAGPAHAIDSGKLAACSGVKGTCDIVSQNCSNGSECIVTENGSTFSTVCSTDLATEHLPTGSACCPNDVNGNECDPGLECNGGNDCTDGGSPGAGLPPGWGGSRCTPHCCPTDGGANTANCGTAGDGGVQGHCELTIVDNSNSPLYTVCTYASLCEPFGVRPCLSGFACTEENAAGTSDCVVIFNPGGDAGGLGAGATCQYGNQCAAGLTCAGAASGDASTCGWECHVAGTPLPFDAGSSNTPGHGGCPSGQVCEGFTPGTPLPAWFGVCAPQ